MDTPGGRTRTLCDYAIGSCRSVQRNLVCSSKGAFVIHSSPFCGNRVVNSYISLTGKEPDQEEGNDEREGESERRGKIYGTHDPTRARKKKPINTEVSSPEVISLRHYGKPDQP